jgi:phosphoribosyl 1,2-cyclic phosphodiesterase
MMKVKFWGTRGSIASPGKATVKYGGNTSCVELRVDNQILIFDAGTGIRDLGNVLVKEAKSQPTKLHLFISHTHWDHIQGFPFVIPAYQNNFQIFVYGPPARDKSLKDLMRFQMDSEYFPVPLGDLKAQLIMQEVRDNFWIGNIQVIPFYVNHPAMTLAYKVLCEGKTFVYASDNEPYRYTLHAARKEEVASKFGAELDEKYIEFLEGTDFLVCEAQYTANEYKSKIGWGHSPLDSVIEFATKAHVKQLALFHHDPSHDDTMIDMMVKQAQHQIKGLNATTRCLGAAEGLELTI